MLISLSMSMVLAGTEQFAERTKELSVKPQISSQDNSEKQLSTQDTSISTQEKADKEDEKEANPSLENLNRGLYTIHQLLDGLFVKPAATLYDMIVPNMIQDKVGNFLDNLFRPVSSVNHLLQGKPLAAANNLVSFGINTTMGLGGFYNVTREAEMKEMLTGFSDTLVTWGVKPGAYIFVPIIGPSTVRGIIGFSVDWLSDPTNITLQSHKHLRHLLYTRQGVYLVHNRAKLLEALDALEAGSLDSYSALKSFYLQKISVHDRELIEECKKKEDTSVASNDASKSKTPNDIPGHKTSNDAASAKTKAAISETSAEITIPDDGNHP